MVGIRLEDDQEFRTPSLLTVNDRLQVIGEKVKQIQVEMFKLEVVQKMNGHRDDDLVPGSDQTYVAQMNVYSDGLKRIEIGYPDYIDLMLGSQKGI